MVIDDTNDKVRRNVVTLSAAIVVMAFFGLSLSPQASIGLFVKGEFPAWKVWACLLAALVYCFLRYRFESSTDQAIQHMQKEHGSIRDRLVETLLAKDIRAHILTGRRPVYITDIDEEPFVEENRRQGLGRLRDVGVRVSFTKEERPTKWAGRVSVALTLEGEHGISNRQGGNLREFRVSGIKRAQFQLRALGRVLYSKGAVDVWMPFGLSAIAACICVYRLLYIAVN
ncbi:hypothetical protein PMO31116_03607 [Pandoraea morbifera]|uniref:Uncharacterized protein n=1 Tax=Pandoraea morbifera TaxID=2508300 RepID=A0A5E4X3X0_9BURK|nr:hypothetical protein PMO31116_03607 [Pandoraea morbifera]